MFSHKNLVVAAVGIKGDIAHVGVYRCLALERRTRCAEANSHRVLERVVHDETFDEARIKAIASACHLYQLLK